MKKIIAFVSSIALLSPLLVSAQQLTDINSVATKATNIGNLVVGLAISFAVIFIIFSVIKYLIAGGEEDKKKGGMAILYGVIGLFVILSIWGLVAILRNSFRTQDQIPTGDINRVLTLPPPANVPN